jgi:citrate synthase
MKTKGLSKEEAAEEIVAEYKREGKRVPGLGHPLHPHGDPRAIAIKNVAVANGFWGEKCEIYEAVRQEFVKAKGIDLPINIDGMMACVLSEMDFHPFEMAGIGAVSFMAGIIAHVVEELLYGAPIRIIPPEHGAKYVGIPERHLPDEYKRNK